MSLYTLVSNGDGTVTKFHNTSPITLKVPRRGVRFVRSLSTPPAPKITGPAPLYRAPGYWRGAAS